MGCLGHWRQGSDNLELVGVVLVKEGDGDAHDAVVIAGDRVGEGDFDGVVVVVPVVGRLALDLLVFAEPQLSSMVMSGSFWWRRPWSRFVYQRTPLTRMYLTPVSRRLASQLR